MKPLKGIIKSYELLFSVPEREDIDWYNEDAESPDKQFEWDNTYHIYNTIHELTNDDAIGEKREILLTKLKESEFVKEINILEDGSIIILTKNGLPDISFGKLSDIFPKLKDNKKLGNFGRRRHCHTKSKEISTRLEFPNVVVTGYAYSISTGDRILHSWVEFNKDGKDWVIDYTMNVMMEKKGYYYLRHIIELCRIDHNDILSDRDLFFPLEKISIKEYMVFRHELAKDLKRVEKQLKKTL
jgi:hypothetical protein